MPPDLLMPAGGLLVAYYRLYHVRDGHFVGVELIEAEEDGAAVRAAQERVGELPAELWCGDRKVSTLTGLGPARTAGSAISAGEDGPTD